MISRRKLYILLSVGLLAGYVLVFFEILSQKSAKDTTPDLCLFKIVTGLPCPSCGSTRSVLSLINGNLMDAVKINPLGLIIAAILLFSPFWLAYDLITGRESLYRNYLKAEALLRRPLVAAPLILLLLANWVWNIAKGL